MDAIEVITGFSKKRMDSFYPCPRCGRMNMDRKPTRNALSRRADVYVCNTCGTIEAVEDSIGKKPPLEEWAVVKYPEKYGMEAGE